MAKEYAKAFYASTIWHKQRAAYIRSRHGLCERCGLPADIVHHRTHITPATIDDERITLDFRNLELLCQACHNAEHMASSAAGDGLCFDSDGNIRQIPPQLYTCSWGECTEERPRKEHAGRI